MPALIECRDVRKTYRGAAAPALDGVDLEVPEGARFGLLGPNGAGKTTLLTVALGLRRKDAGTLRVAGLDADREVGKIRRAVGLAPQELGFYPMLTVAENLRLYAGGPNPQAIAFAVEATQLGAQLGKRADALSGGLQRRLNLALSLLGEPRVLFLDEPTVGVDPQSRAFILDVIRRLNIKRGLTVVYSSHYMEEVQQLCNHVAILDHGKVLAQGTLNALLGQGRALHAVLAAEPDDRLRAALLGVGAALNGRAVTMDAGGAEALAALAQAVREHGAELESATLGHRDLESLFLDLTQRTLRD